MSNRDKYSPHKGPVPIRRNVQDYDDPYISDEHLMENSICRVCGDIYTAGRWYNPDQLNDRWERTHVAERHYVVCPGCRKQADRMPAGVLRLTGDFVNNHRDEILNLIRNETKKADSINPLERVIGIEADETGMEITTTTEKLAQRLGKAINKAYSGDIEYKWSEDNKLVRIYWNRNI